MALNETIDDHATGTYVVTRTQDGTWTRGRYTPGAPSTFPIVASVQPLDGLQIADLPEGQVAAEKKWLGTATQLKTRRGPSDVIEADFVAIDGEQWRVDAVEKVDHWGETHYECVVSRFNTP